MKRTAASSTTPRRNAPARGSRWRARIGLRASWRITSALAVRASNTGAGNASSPPTPNWLPSRNNSDYYSLSGFSSSSSHPSFPPSLDTHLPNVIRISMSIDCYCLNDPSNWLLIAVTIVTGRFRCGYAASVPAQLLSIEYRRHNPIYIASAINQIELVPFGAVRADRLTGSILDQGKRRPVNRAKPTRLEPSSHRFPVKQLILFYNDQGGATSKITRRAAATFHAPLTAPCLSGATGPRVIPPADPASAPDKEK